MTGGAVIPPPSVIPAEAGIQEGAFFVQGTSGIQPSLERREGGRSNEKGGSAPDGCPYTAGHPGVIIGQDANLIRELAW